MNREFVCEYEDCNNKFVSVCNRCQPSKVFCIKHCAKHIKQTRHIPNELSKNEIEAILIKKYRSLTKETISMIVDASNQIIKEINRKAASVLQTIKKYKTNLSIIQKIKENLTDRKRLDRIITSAKKLFHLSSKHFQTLEKPLEKITERFSKSTIRKIEKSASKPFRIASNNPTEKYTKKTSKKQKPFSISADYTGGINESISFPSFDFDIITIDKELVYMNKTSRYTIHRESNPCNFYDGIFDKEKVCIKVYSLKSEQSELSMVKKEIKLFEKLSSQLNYEGFLTYHGAFIENNSINLVMDWYEYNLIDIINMCQGRSFKFSETRYLNIIRDLVFYFKVMVELGIFHSDIRPHNMFVDDYWSIKIIDFQLATINDHEFDVMESKNKPIENCECYFSPEIKLALSSKTNSPSFDIVKSDIYSLGVVLYQLMTFNNSSIYKMSHNMIIADIDNVSNFSKETKDIIKKMLIIDPASRPTFSNILDLVDQNPILYRTLSPLKPIKHLFS